MRAELKKDTSKNSFVVYPKHAFIEPNSLIFNLNTYGYEEIGENYYLKRSNFHGNMLTYIAKGSGYFSFGGRTYLLKEHDLILINCMDEHIMYPNKSGMTIYFMHVDNFSLTDFAKTNNKEFGCITNFSDTPRILEIFKDIIDPNNHYDIHELSIKIYEILIAIKKKNVLNNDVFKNSPPHIKQTSTYIKENFSKINLSLDEIASYVGFNKFYLEKAFKKYTNFTIHSYLNYIRVLNARMYLLETTDSIEKVAILSGFADSQSLIRYFRKYFQETPLQFRKKRSIF